ncbi:hypothetical protein DM02DRAFT_607789 [Periconia macrospinosa]|uniref:STB6-like N-terminal domain-containing protein n=1 Tax=Periconia macrospinosa TaxID=97972 RepID=A0A2V1ECT7_9PLEO|nr:hypothetical protein DM02DRAFT_607789 [Periconia macrospinosa]
MSLHDRDLRSHSSRTQTTTIDTSSLSRHDSIKSPPSSESARTPSTSEHATHQRFVLTDYVAFRYLEDDPGVTVLSRREKLEGYEIYLVEQWACSRVHPTFIITTYTGDPKDTAWAGVISVSKDESHWSPTMRIYFKALNEYHARRKETNLGTLMITNLNGFPSSLTIIPVPDGDLRKNRELFFVNENLKRLGCSGRLGIKLAEPSSATQAKFYQLYRTSDKVPFHSAVIELVKLCQVALFVFGKLAPEYADGLLCDITERAVNDWWVEFGAEYYTVEPHDGILGPTTVAALLGLLMGARNRLSAYNAPVAKDVFDMDSTVKAISHFQKAQRIQKTRILDRQTLERLRRATAKAATKESWAVPRAFKSTVAELGGKGGEMVMGMVGAGEKAGIADIETVDIDRFIELVSGERAKWLWYGKPRKSNTNDMFNRLPGGEDASSPSDYKRDHSQDNYSAAPRNSMEIGLTKRTESAWINDTLERERDPYSKRAVIKRATDKIESGTGFHRIKDKVNRRNHQPKPSKDDVTSPTHHQNQDSHLAALIRQESSRRSAELGRASMDVDPTFTKVLTETPRGSASTLAVEENASLKNKTNDDSLATVKPSHTEKEESKPPTVEPSIAGSIYRGIDLNDKLPFEEASMVPPFLRRTHSTDQLASYLPAERNDNRWPRHLSFSIAEESILTWNSIVPTTTTFPSPLTATASKNLYDEFATQRVLSEEAKRLYHHLSLVSTHDLAWSQTHLSTVTNLDASADQDAEQLDTLYYPALETYQGLREDAHEIISSNRAHLTDALRELTNVGDKLEYEIGGLRSRVDDVEDGVVELERLVVDVEERVRELESVLGGTEREGWVRWMVRILTGIDSRA